MIRAQTLGTAAPAGEAAAAGAEVSEAAAEPGK
jgi:hypothetical protein